MENFKKTILFTKAANNIYDALTKSITKWWTEIFEGVSDIQEKNFTIRFGANIFKTMRVKELIPGKKVVWYVTDSLIDIPELKNKTEWISTMIVWEIETIDEKTALHLTHVGLTQQVECYNICESGWHNFTQSLEMFINTGKGNPFSAE